MQKDLYLNMASMHPQILSTTLSLLNINFPTLRKVQPLQAKLIEAVSLIQPPVELLCNQR